MGLDQYVFATESDIPDVDFDTPAECSEVFYWRKHPDLHGWMEQLYRSKGGKEPMFNIVSVQLDMVDIGLLEHYVKRGALPKTEGFFFGRSVATDREEDVKFIELARGLLAAGQKLFYTSWW